MKESLCLCGLKHLSQSSCLQEGHTDSGVGFPPEDVKGLNRHLPTTPNFRWGLQHIIPMTRISKFVGASAQTACCFRSAASCCAVRVKSRWPQSHPIKPADTSRGTTLTTQTRQSMLTRRWSWSTTCWRSLHRTKQPTNSTWRSATARRRSDPAYTPTTKHWILPLYSICVRRFLPFKNNDNTRNRATWVSIVALSYFHRR